MTLPKWRFLRVVALCVAGTAALGSTHALAKLSPEHPPDVVRPGEMIPLDAARHERIKAGDDVLLTIVNDVRDY